MSNKLKVPVRRRKRSKSPSARSKPHKPSSKKSPVSFNQKPNKQRNAKKPAFAPIRTKEVESKEKDPNNENQWLISTSIRPITPSDPPHNADLPDGFVADASLTNEEREVFDCLNAVRANPGSLAEYIRTEFLAYYDPKKKAFKLPRNNGVLLNTRERDEAYLEAVEFLENQKELPPFSLSAGLTFAARDHVMDSGPRGLTGHDGSDMSKPAVRMNFYGEWLRTCGENIACSNHMGFHSVAQLVADDGVPSRGHRANVFSDEYKVVGVAVGPHVDFEKICVMDFAGGFSDDLVEKQKLVHTRRAKKLYMNVVFAKPVVAVKKAVKKAVSPTKSTHVMPKGRNVLKKMAFEYGNFE